MPSYAEQIPLELGHRVAMGRDDFMVAPSNQEAVAWIDRWPDWTAPALIIYGPPASGKTHLAAVWQEQTQYKHKLIEDIDTKIGNLSFEEQIFHLYNQAKEDQDYILITAESTPKQWDFKLPDLASRLRAAPAVEIAPPDDTLLAAMLVKLFHDRQLDISTEVMAYIIPRIERSYDAARQLVHRADHLALAGKRAITIPIIKAALASTTV